MVETNQVEDPVLNQLLPLCRPPARCSEETYSEPSTTCNSKLTVRAQARELLGLPREEEVVEEERP